MGTFDLLRGTKPAGVDSFAGMQLLVERGQSRFSSAFQARGKLYRSWFKFALEIEREFGEETRIRASLSPARTWTLKKFEKSRIQGDFEVIVEDGSQTPKTTLGRRAAIEHLNSLGFLDPSDPDQKYKVFEEFGQTRLAPSLDIHMQAALRKQQAFLDWAVDEQAQQVSVQLATQAFVAWQQQIQAATPPPAPPASTDPATGQPIPAPMDDQAMQAALPPPPSLTLSTPLAWKPWYNPVIHKQEFLKWANSDEVIELLKANPPLEALLVAHLQEIDQALAMQAPLAPGAGPTPPQGAGIAMKNSNQEAGGVQTANSQ